MSTPVARLVPMSAADLASWQGGSRPEPPEGHEVEALEIELGDVAVGGVLLDHCAPGGHRRTTIVLLETSLEPDDREHWPAVLAALESHAAGRGAGSVFTAVPPALLARFQDAGWAATMADVGVATGDRAERVFAETDRVRVRPMTADERRAFVPEARAILRDGMAGAGVLAAADAPIDEVETRLEALLDPPEAEVLLVAVVDGAPVGRFWGTLVPGTDGTGRRDLVGNTIDVFPEHRGQGLVRPFMSALEDHVRAHGLRDVRGRLYGHDHRARTSLGQVGVGIDLVHLRKDLDHPVG